MLNNLRLDPSIVFDDDLQTDELKSKTVKGGFALVISQGSSFAFSMISAVVLARLLTPDDFGIIGMVTVVINFLFIFKDIGLAHATIQRDTITSAQISTLFWINGLISVFLGIIIVSTSPLVANFYARPELTAVMSALAISFVLEGFGIQHNTLLRRHFKFTTLAIIDIASRFAHLVVAITMAVLGYSYWALVGGSIARSIVLLGLTYASCPWMPGRMRRGAGVRGMIKFGGHVTIGHFLAYLARNLDKILIGKFLGAVPLGLYNKAHHLLIVPLSQIRLPLNSLALPVLSSLKHETNRYQSYFLKLLDVSITVSIPLCVYSFIEAEWLIHVILGPKWVEAGPIFKILAAGGVFISVSYLPGLAMLSNGYSKRYMQISITTAVITSAAFVVGILYGINGVAASYSIGCFLVLIPMYMVSFRGTPIKSGPVFRTILWPLLTSLAAGVAIYLVILSFPVESIVAHLLVGILFFIVYTGLTLLRTETRKTMHSIWVSMMSKRMSNN